MIVFIGMETSGALRREFAALGHLAISCDLLPSEDGSEFSPATGGHIQGDVFVTLRYLRRIGMWPSLAIFHPTCTFLTNSAEWAYADPDFDRYPGVGYHQQLQPGTLCGLSRRIERKRAIQVVLKILALSIDQIVVENPVGVMSSIEMPDQIYQPNWFGDDISKATCIWLRRTYPIIIDWTKWKRGRMAEWPKGSGKLIERWGNQTDSGQDRNTPSDIRWKERSRTPPIPQKLSRFILAPVASRQSRHLCSSLTGW